MLRELAPALLLTTLTTACAARRATINSYVDPTFDRASIRSLALFPIRNARFAPAEAQQINRRISTAINTRNPSLRMMAAVEAVNLLNENQLADEWARFLDNYVSSGVPDANKLRRIGQVLGVDGIMQGEIVNVSQQDGTSGRRGLTRVTVRFTMLDCRLGKLLWEASSDGLTEGRANSPAPPIIEAVYLAVDRILAALPL